MRERSSSLKLQAIVGAVSVQTTEKPQRFQSSSAARLFPYPASSTRFFASRNDA
jgi:hypothetical protein